MRLNSIKVIFISLAILTSCLSSQTKVKTGYQLKYNISHSIGIGFKQHELAFYLSISRSINRNIALGLIGGIYDYNENTVNKILDTFITPGYAELNPGHYQKRINNMTIQGSAYIGSVRASYKVLNSFILNASLGVKLYRESDYSFTLEFDKPTENNSAPKAEDLYLEELRPFNVQTIIKPYFSVGADYSLGQFNFGVYADNIYSAGINLGVSF